MTLTASNRKLDMHSVFFHLVGLLPWSLGNVDGSMVASANDLLQSHAKENLIFEELSSHIFE